MKIYKLFYVLYKIRLLNPFGLLRLIRALLECGINLMALLHFAGSAYGDKTALTDDKEILSYKQLYEESKKLALILEENYRLKSGRKVGFLCRNHSYLVKSVFAVSLLGADIYLLNAEMSSCQFGSFADRIGLDMIIYDYELDSLISQSNYSKEKIPCCHDCLPAINNLLKLPVDRKLKPLKTSRGKLVLLTGGTTGNFKEAAHKPSVFNFLNPFYTLLIRLNLLDCTTAYIATPIYHGYGIGLLFLYMALGKKVVICKGFDAEKACSLIRRYNVDVVTVVPLMLYKMLKCDAEALRSLSCIASGGAELNPKLAGETLAKLGNVLYNLYGTSETGLNILATPEDLQNANNTIGRKIDGVRLKILDKDMREVGAGVTGQFYIRNRWSVISSGKGWIGTGDLGCMDSKGYYYLSGRADDMVVSGGENVYPVEIEQVLLKHAEVEEAAVIGIDDEHFGKRLIAFVHLAETSVLTREELLGWMRSNVARYQMPKDIIFVDNMPYTSVGKLDRKKLRERVMD